LSDKLYSEQEKVDKKHFRINNFDLLRLFASLQVAVNHTIDIMQVEPPGALRYILYFSYYFPGVPIFFFISGFLISKSYEGNHRLKEYLTNRALRLYPGLTVCVLLTFISIAASGYMQKVDRGVCDWALLFFAKTTFVQFYNPDFMRAFGDGVLNGSLWTITVEIQFYILIPLIYSAFDLKDPTKANRTLIMLIVLFLIINGIYRHIPGEYHQAIPFKLAVVSFFPWLYMFLAGMLVQKNFGFFHRYLSNKIYANNLGLGNNINPLLFVFLAATIFSFAYSYTSLNKKLLRGNDISYGLYIYHMPVVDFLIYIGLSASFKYSIFAMLIAVGLAIISWVLIEKPCLRLKMHPLKPQKQISS
jgi:peptidoglycan/LPS O-acetylase OafA/YrhL